LKKASGPPTPPSSAHRRLCACHYLVRAVGRLSYCRRRVGRLSSRSRNRVSLKFAASWSRAQERMAWGIQWGCKTAVGSLPCRWSLLKGPFQGWPPTGHRVVGYGGAKQYFRESMDTPFKRPWMHNQVSCHKQIQWRTRMTGIHDQGGNVKKQYY
jgi:hypothetical protein